MACIEQSGMCDGALTNVERIMAHGPSGEAVGLKMDSAVAVNRWIDSVDEIRCRCFMTEPEIWVPRGTLSDW